MTDRIFERSDQLLKNKFLDSSTLSYFYTHNKKYPLQNTNHNNITLQNNIVTSHNNNYASHSNIHNDNITLHNNIKNNFENYTIGQ